MAYVGTFRSRVVDAAAGEFTYYMHRTKQFPKKNCLADFVEQWLIDGGVEDCSDSREIFLMAFPIIIDIWLRDPSILDYGGDDETPAFERRVTTVFNTDEHGDRFYDVIDPYSFESKRTDPNRTHYEREAIRAILDKEPS